MVGRPQEVTVEAVWVLRVPRGSGGCWEDPWKPGGCWGVPQSSSGGRGGPQRSGSSQRAAGVPRNHRSKPKRGEELHGMLARAPRSPGGVKAGRRVIEAI